MKNTRILRASGAAILSTAFFLALAATSHADLLYKVNLAINQAALTSSSGPFSLDFQLTAGSGTVLNAVSLYNFQITGGSFTAGTEGNSGSGNINGSLLSNPASVNLSNGFPGNVQLVNEDWVAFGTGVTNISFFVDETNNTELPFGTATPDSFTVSVLDNGLNYMGTTGTVDPQALVYGTSGMGSISSLGLGNSSDAGGVTTTVSNVPEPGSAALLIFGAVGLIARRKRTTTSQTA